MSTGLDDTPFPADGPPTHWDQMLRYLPAGIKVKKGQTIKVAARHTDDATHIGVLGVEGNDLMTVGHPDIVRSEHRMSVGAATCGTSVHLANGPSGAYMATKQLSGRNKAVAEALRDVSLFDQAVRETNGAYTQAFAVMVLSGEMPIEQLEKTSGGGHAMVLQRL